MPAYASLHSSLPLMLEGFLTAPHLLLQYPVAAKMWNKFLKMESMHWVMLVNRCSFFLFSFFEFLLCLFFGFLDEIL